MDGVSVVRRAVGEHEVEFLGWFPSHERARLWVEEHGRFPLERRVKDGDYQLSDGSRIRFYSERNGGLRGVKVKNR